MANINTKIGTQQILTIFFNIYVNIAYEPNKTDERGHHPLHLKISSHL